MKLDSYTIVLLRRPADAPEYSDEKLADLQREHIAFNARMRQEGHALVTGPFEGQPDPSWRGINIFRTCYVPAGLLEDRPAAQIEDD